MPSTLKVGDLVVVKGKGQGEIRKIHERRARVLLDDGSVVWRQTQDLEVGKNTIAVLPPTPRGPAYELEHEKQMKRFSQLVSLKELGINKQLLGHQFSLKPVENVHDTSMPRIEQDAHISANPVKNLLAELNQTPHLKSVKASLLNHHDAPLIEKGTAIHSDPRQFVLHEIKEGHIFSRLLGGGIPATRSRSGSTGAMPPPTPSLIDLADKLKYRNPYLELFDLKQTLGIGSFGRVRLVQDKNTKKHHALKILHKADILALGERDHVNNERILLQSVSHPFILNLLGTFQDRRNLYMILEYVPGGELFKVHREAVQFTETVARFYAASIILALLHLHSKNIAYRDLKPENVLIAADGYLKLADFGSAKIVTELTHTMCGTPEYQSPEIIKRKGHNHLADAWSVGIIVFEFLAGETPFVADTPFQIYKNIMKEDIVFPGHFSADAKDLISRLVERDLDTRMPLKDARKHAWFAGFDWAALENRKMPPPHVPKVSGETDTSNFNSYPEVDIFSGPIVDKEMDKFPEF